MAVAYDLLHILVATVAALIAGYIWYHPLVFGTQWRELVKEYTGMTDDDLKPEPLRQIPMWFFVTLINPPGLDVYRVQFSMDELQ